MVRFPDCKINLGLNILQKRNDGYHDIESVFIPVPWCDVLEIIPADNGITQFFASGIMLGNNPEDNLCMKAFRLLEKDYGIEPVHIHLHKNIPAGAGLGGGSSDGAFTLSMLNEMSGLNLDHDQLRRYALMLGSDCPFFVENRPMLAKGRGDLLSPVTLSLAGFHILIVKPPVHISTALAYSKVTPAMPEIPLHKVIELPPERWPSLLHNDFEKPLAADFPVIAQIKQRLYEHGAVYASLSGSGSAVYGLFREKPDVEMTFVGFTQWQGILNV